MSECKKDCICLNCNLHGKCDYDDCKWCKGKDGVNKCAYFEKKDNA